MIELDSVDRKAAAALEGYLVRKDLVEPSVVNFQYRLMLLNFCWDAIVPVLIRKRSTRGLKLFNAN